MWHIGPCFMRSLSRYWYQSPLFLWSASEWLMADYRNTTHSAETAVWLNPTFHPDKHSPIPQPKVNEPRPLWLTKRVYVINPQLSLSNVYHGIKMINPIHHHKVKYRSDCKFQAPSLFGIDWLIWFDPLQNQRNNTKERKDSAMGGDFRCKPEPRRDHFTFTVC